MRTLQFIGTLSSRRRQHGGGSTPPPTSPEPDNSPNGLGEGLEFVLPPYELRVGTSYSFGIIPPAGYSVTWKIEDARSFLPGKTRRILATGSGTTANYTPTTCVDADGRFLSIYLQATFSKGSDLIFTRRSKRMAVYPARVTSEAGFNLVIDLSQNGAITYRDNAGIDRTGYRVGLKGTGSSSAYMGLERWVSSNLNAPVVFQNVPGQKAVINHTGTNYGLKITQGCRNLLIDGGGDPDIQYGIELNMINNGAQIVYIEGWGPAAATGAMNIALNRVYGNGNGVVQGAGFEIATSATSGINYASGFAFRGPQFTDCFVEDTISEGNYIGRFTDDQGYAPIEDLLILRMRTKDTGADGIQVGLSRNSEICECTVENAGYRNDPNHRNGIQINPGNKNVYWFRNRILSSINTLSSNSGIHAGDQEIFSNLFVNKTNNMPSNFYFGLFQNQDSSSIDLKVFNNCIITPSGASGNVPFYIAKSSGGVTTVFNKLILANNLILNKDTTQYATLNSPSLAFATIDNYITTNSSAPGFKNYATGNYELSSLESPAYQSVNNTFTGAHQLAAEDLDGYGYVLPVNHCYAGVKMMT